MNEKDAAIQGLQAATPKKMGRPRGMDNLPLVLDPNEVKAYEALPLRRKGELLREEFARVAYLVLKRAKHFVPTVSKTDFGKVTQLVTAAGIAYDKVVPKGEHLGINMQVNLFNGLPSAGIGAVLGQSEVIEASATPMPIGDPASGDPVS